MTRISLVSIAFILIVSHASQALADPLADKVASMNAQWDAAINNADFDALLPLYTADGRLMRAWRAARQRSSGDPGFLCWAGKKRQKSQA